MQQYMRDGGIDFAYWQLEAPSRSRATGGATTARRTGTA